MLPVGPAIFGSWTSTLHHTIDYGRRVRHECTHFAQQRLIEK